MTLRRLQVPALFRESQKDWFSYRIAEACGQPHRKLAELLRKITTRRTAARYGTPADRRRPVVAAYTSTTSGKCVPDGTAPRMFINGEGGNSRSSSVSVARSPSSESFARPSAAVVGHETGRRHWVLSHHLSAGAAGEGSWSPKRLERSPSPRCQPALSRCPGSQFPELGHRPSFRA